MGPSWARRGGAKRPGGSPAVARQHHRAWRGAGGPLPPVPRCVWRCAKRSGSVLRCGTGVRPDPHWPSARYPELGGGGPLRLRVLAKEVRGHWSDEAQQFGSTRPAQGAPRAAGLARSSCAGLGAPLVEHSGSRGPAYCLQPCWARGACSCAHGLWGSRDHAKMRGKRREKQKTMFSITLKNYHHLCYITFSMILPSST